MRPLLGRSPLTVRNLWRGDSDLLTLDNPFNATVTPVAQSVGPFAQVAEIVATSASSSFAGRTNITSVPGAHCLSAFVPATGNTTTIGFVDDRSGEASVAVEFNAATGAFLNTGNSDSRTATPVDGGWLVEVVYSRSSGLFRPGIWVRGFTSSDTGLKVRVAGVQFEQGTSRSAYQRTFGPRDITEAGVPSPAYIRFDLSDDVLPTTFPDGGTFDVMVFGREGSWIERGVTIAPGGSLNIGPGTITGGPAGVLAALGLIVGWTAVDRTLTDAEITRLVQYHKARGAKGLLVPGPELILNPDFADGGANWTQTGAWSFADDAAVAAIATDPQANRLLIPALSLDVGRLYTGAITVRSTTGPASYTVRMRNNATGTTPDVVNSGAFTTASAFPVTGVGLFTAQSADVSVTYFRTGNDPGDILVEQVSLRELRPEEDW